jgi:transcriptional regulator with PAS, ATPase and Fis domain
MLLSYSWPGNVRELENVMERAVIMSGDVLTITPDHLGIHVPLDINALQDASRTLPEIAAEAVRLAESAAIQRALRLTAGNKSEAARNLGVSYKTLLNKIKEYHLEIGELC